MLPNWLEKIMEYFLVCVVIVLMILITGLVSGIVALLATAAVRFICG